MAYNTWKGDAAVGDVVNQDDIDTLIDWDENTITLKTNNAARLVVDNSSVSGSGDLEFAGNTFLGNTLNVSGASTFAGNVLPVSDNTKDLGSASKRWANVYTGDLHLKNDKGDWTIVEEEEYLCVINNKTGKKYEMVLKEIKE